MPEKKTTADIKDLGEFRIKYFDVFHLKNLYISMHEWLAEDDWYGMPGGPRGGEPKYSRHSDIETLYFVNDYQKGLHRGGKEMWIWWRLWKNAGGKYGKYFKFRLELDMHVEYMQDKEVMHQGKKMKANYGEIELFLRPYIESEMHVKWQNHWLLKHFVEIFENRVWSQEIEKMEKDLWRQVYRFQGNVKRYLDLRTFIPTPEPFHPKQFGMGH
ncbi:MAG: hypothetical protein KJ601_03975 [Nanoarchaeota archaeon]|nr:hypothetical protein [Nanoarchaeota archaeon]MBU1704005.1 hypothetical protein [Nanoarchaeota archaeon]